MIQVCLLQFSSYIYKMLSATSEEEVNTLGRALEHNLTVCTYTIPLLISLASGVRASFCRGRAPNNSRFLCLSG